ncbi:MAG: hypothetical protein ACO2PM_04545 [Pyrobaculum sp.]
MEAASALAPPRRGSEHLTPFAGGCRRAEAASRVSSLWGRWEAVRV